MFATSATSVPATRFSSPFIGRGGAAPQLRGEAVSAQLHMQAQHLTNGNEAGEERMRKKVGEFVGSVFYGTLLRQIQDSKLKGEYMHGGRGEEVFRGQLNQELAKRMGTAPNDPITERLYESIQRSLPGGRAKQDGMIPVAQPKFPEVKEHGAS